ncbi:diguanylate cyclase [Nocardia sp. NPDC088792]|uniref:GGDEF domain-containing protein n=1 Tax=Nocardia sp. NPDC088792 TaxID=3364332 RepID=UPI0037F5E0A9
MRAWWRDPVDYRWLVRTLEARWALGIIKNVVGAGGAVMAVITALTWASTAGPTGVGVIVDAVNVIAGILWALYWWTAPWPDERRSLILMAVADVLVLLGSTFDSDRVYGSLGVMLLVVTGGYLTFFHGPRILALHAVWSLLSVLALSALMVADHDGDIALAIAIILTMAAATVVVLPALHFCYWVLRVDALSDPLTTLLNRRGLDYYLSGWFRSEDGTPICVMTVDLDRFKAVNDTYGHSAGDQVLVEIAACLRSSVAPGAIVARSGGEEFVVIAHLTTHEAIAEAERLCHAIEAAAQSSTPVTASIGVAVAEGDSGDRCPERLLHNSDSAMYRAKQLGGNTVVLAATVSERRDAGVRIEPGTN